MTTPGPVAGDTGTPDQNQVIAAQLQGQAQTVTGDPTAAGVYGDPAGASQVTPPQTPAQVATDLAAKGGAATEVDTAALLAQIKAQGEALAALQSHVSSLASAPGAVVSVPAKPPVLEEVISSLTGAAPGVVHAITVIAERLAAAGI